MTVIERPSPNFNDRRAAVNCLVLHYTNMPTSEGALQRLCDPAMEVSAHYLIDEHGAIFRLVAEDKRAWHAGRSYWDGETDINSRSIGIELAHPGHAGGYPPFAAAQMRALAELCRGILTRHAIPLHRILGHSDIAPDRKTDPGEGFPWPAFAVNGIGLWPAPDDADYAAAPDLIADETRLRAALTAYGYTPEGDLRTIVAAFQRHFQPEAFPDVGMADIEAAARLSSLLRLKNAP